MYVVVFYFYPVGRCASDFEPVILVQANSSEALNVVQFESRIFHLDEKARSKSNFRSIWQRPSSEFPKPDFALF
jgi:hypothetical protein